MKKKAMICSLCINFIDANIARHPLHRPVHVKKLAFHSISVYYHEMIKRAFMLRVDEAMHISFIRNRTRRNIASPDFTANVSCA